jgi:hypothetical protein
VTSPLPGPLLGARAPLVMMCVFMTGLAAAGLAIRSDNSLPSAVLTGGGATAGALLFFNKIIGD